MRDILLLSGPWEARTIVFTLEAAWRSTKVFPEMNDIDSVKQEHSPVLKFWKQLGQADSTEGSIGEAVGLGQIPACGQVWLSLLSWLSPWGQPLAWSISCGHFQPYRKKTQMKKCMWGGGEINETD